MAKDADNGSDVPRKLPFVVSATCLVTVKANGLQLDNGVFGAPLRLGLPELHLLAALDANPVVRLMPVVEQASADTGAEFAALSDFVIALRMSERLVQAPAPRHRPVADGPYATAPPLDLEAGSRVVLRTPLVLRLTGGRFELIGHDGARVALLSPAEVAVLELFVQPVDPRAALAGAPEGVRAGVDEERLSALLGVLHEARLLPVIGSSPEQVEPSLDQEAVLRRMFDRHAAAQDAAEAERVARTGNKRTKVVPVAFDMGIPAGVGMVVAYAREFEGGRLQEAYDFRTDWVWSDERLPGFTREPAIYLFSNYLWSHERCIEVSRRVKELSPGSITVHGGPDTPKYEADGEAYLAAHPHVDVIVRGEGELSATETLAALAGVVGVPEPDLSVLAGVEGITYRDGERVVRNPDRDRIADMNTLPSPFLNGLYDVYAEADIAATLETNRGCPYSCSFCDWGSSTNSRVRQFDIGRVYAELDWCSKMGVSAVAVADANFGMFKRDVEIVEHLAELRRTSGYPHSFGVSFAKNTVKHLQHIIRLLADVGILAQGVLALQTMDEVTLGAIHRSNIKTERYDQLADEMRRAHLPLMVELMMGLPGQTVDSLADDIQQCIDRELPTRINHTTLLVNSPMNHPDYLAEHRIVTAQPIGPGMMATVISTSSFGVEDFAAMEKLRLDSLLYENYGALRLVSRFVRQETGMREIDFYRYVRSGTEVRPEARPALTALAALGASMMTAPFSWALVMDELRELLVDELGVEDGPALASVLRTQRAQLPAHGRRYPEVVELDRDVVTWHDSLVAAKTQGHATDWTEVVARLRDHGPGTITVDDVDDTVTKTIGMASELSAYGANWELDSPLSRARIAASQLLVVGQLFDTEWVTDTASDLPNDAAGPADAVPVTLGRR